MCRRGFVAACCPHAARRARSCAGVPPRRQTIRDLRFVGGAEVALLGALERGELDFAWAGGACHPVPLQDLRDGAATRLSALVTSRKSQPRARRSAFQCRS